MVKVKICGIRRHEDVEYVNMYKPDYIGLIFAESKRKVTVEQAKELLKGLDRGILRVGVFVNEDTDEVIRAMLECELDILQIHGDEDERYIEGLKSKVDNLINIEEAKRNIQIWKAIRVRDYASLKSMEGNQVDGFVLEA